MDEITLQFLIFGIVIVLIIFIIIGLVVFYVQRNKHKQQKKTKKNEKKLSKTPYNLSNNVLSLQNNSDLEKGLKVANTENRHEPKNGFSQTFCTPDNEKNSKTLYKLDTIDYDNELARSPNLKNGKLRNIIVIDNYTDNNNNNKTTFDQLSEQTNLTTISPKSTNDKLSLKNRPFKIDPLESKIETSASAAISPSIIVNNSLMSSSTSISSNRSSISKNLIQKNPKDNFPLNSTTQITSKMEELQENGNKMLFHEFQILNQKAMNSIQPRTTTAEFNENIRKNRFYDVLPYDFNRVKLKSTENERKSDYINASYVQFDNPALIYIAAQNPIGGEETFNGRRLNTISDFWQMIWQEKVDTIVMLTECYLEDKQKYAIYWPENAGESINIEPNLTVNLYCITENDIFFQREIFLSKSGHSKRRIFQWEFKNWSNNLNLQETYNLLSFIETIRSTKRNYPILVHCSTGVGRTGVFIALDILLEKIEQEHFIDVFAVVSCLRDLRANMVQSSDQYLTVYKIIALAIRKRTAIRNND